MKLKNKIKVSITWHIWAWKIARRIPWKTEKIRWSIFRKYGFLKTLGIYLGLVNLRLSDISFLEWISKRHLIKIYGA